MFNTTEGVVTSPNPVIDQPVIPQIDVKTLENSIGFQINMVMSRKIDKRIKVQIVKTFSSLVLSGDTQFNPDNVELFQGAALLISDVITGKHVNLTTQGEKVRTVKGHIIIYHLPVEVEDFVRKAIPLIAESEAGVIPTPFNSAGASFGKDTVKSVLRGFLSNNMSKEEFFTKMNSTQLKQ